MPIACCLLPRYAVPQVGEGEGEAAIDPFLGPCYECLLGVVRNVISDAVAQEEEAL